MQRRFQNYGLLNTHGRPTPKPRENKMEAEIHFNITEERKTVFTSVFFVFESVIVWRYIGV